MKNKPNILIGIILCASALFFTWIFLFATIKPYAQLIDFETKLNLANNGNASSIMNDSFLFSGDTFVQERLRFELLNYVFNEYASKKLMEENSLLDFAIEKMTDFEKAHGIKKYYEMLLIAKSYDIKDSIFPNTGWYEKAEEYYQKTFVIAPSRQDALFVYAIHLASHGDTNQAFALLHKIRNDEPLLPEVHYYLGALTAAKGDRYFDDAIPDLEFSLEKDVNPDQMLTRTYYRKFFYFYYTKNDPVRLLVVSKRLAQIDAEQKDTYLAIAEYIEKYHKTPNIDFGQI